MRPLLLTSLILFFCSRLTAQNIDQIINPAEVEKIEKILSADDMQGRASFSPESNGLPILSRPSTEPTVFRPGIMAAATASVFR